MKKGKIEIDYQEFDGLKFLITNPNLHIQTWWMIESYYEPEMIEFIRDNYKKGGTYIDVGACIGNHSLFFSKMADEVQSFEPNHNPYFHLMLNIYVNQLENVKIYNLGLSDMAGIKRMTMLSPETALGGGTIMDNGEFPIFVIPLDSLEFKDVRLIKIDVEGHEVEVLLGAKETIGRDKPDLYIECATKKILKKVTKTLEAITVEYKQYDRKIFNHTPTYLFTVNGFDKYKIPQVKKDEKDTTDRG